MLCITLTISIITSSLTGCATPSVQQPIIGPQVLGYTLNQPLTEEEFNAVTNTGDKWGFGGWVYQRDDGQGGVLRVYLDKNHRPKGIERISQTFDTKDECESVFAAQTVELKKQMTAYNIANRRSENAGRREYLPGERHVEVSGGGCRDRQGDPRDVYRFDLQVRESIETAAPKRGLSDKFHDAYGNAWMTVFVIVLLPFVLIGAAVDAATD
ncbi:hypothetical protein CP336_21675 [Pseudomonas fluorescens]|jgi:hypothetical protein|nr:hypothetical protein CP336_21675 [Pseudomonas fluorescens]